MNSIFNFKLPERAVASVHEDLIKNRIAQWIYYNHDNNKNMRLLK